MSRYRGVQGENIQISGFELTQSKCGKVRWRLVPSQDAFLLLSQSYDNRRHPLLSPFLDHLAPRFFGT